MSGKQMIRNDRTVGCWYCGIQIPIIIELEEGLELEVLPAIGDRKETYIITRKEDESGEA